MKKIDWKMLAWTTIPFLLVFILMLFLYQALPDQLATHFTVHNQANGEETKFTALVVTPFLAFLLHVFLCLALDGVGFGQQPIAKVIKWAIPLSSGLVTLSIIVYNMGVALDYRRLVVLLLALLYLFLGNYFPKDKAGGRIRKGSSKLLRQTGYLFIVAALCLLISLFFPAAVSVIVLAVFGLLMFCWSIFVAIQGYRLSKNKQ